jgi:hypothetical protein
VARKSNFISVVQIAEHRIVWHRFRPSSRGAEPIGHETEQGAWSAADGSLSAALRAFAERNDFVNDTLCTVLPRHDMTSRILTLPTHDDREIAGMIQLSAEEFVPYPVEELVIDHTVIHRLPDGQAHVLAVFAHRDVVESHVQTLRDAGLEPDRIAVSTACLASVAAAAHPDLHDTSAYVQLAPSGLEIAVMRGPRLEYGRAVAMAATGSDSVVDEIVNEVRGSLAAYRRESAEGSEIDAIYLCCDHAGVQGVADQIAEAIGIPCNTALVPRSLTGGGESALPTPALVSLGGALTVQDDAAYDLSLVPASLRKARSQSALKQQTLRALLVAGGVILVAALLFGQAWFQRSSYLNELEDRIAMVQPTAEGVMSKQRQLQALQEHLDRRGTALELVARLVELMPDSGMTIIEVDFVHGERFNIKCRAEDPGMMHQLADDLREAGQSDTPQFQYAQTGVMDSRRAFDKDVYEFEILMPFYTEGEDEAGEVDRE